MPRTPILSALLPPSRKRSASDDESPLSLGSALNVITERASPLKRPRGTLASLREYAERRAEDLIAAPSGVTFRPEEVFEMLALPFPSPSPTTSALINALLKCKTKLNAAGVKVTIAHRRSWAKEMGTVLKLQGVVMKDLELLETLPPRGETTELKAELESTGVGKARSIELLSRMVTAHLDTVRGAHKARTRQVNLEIEAEEAAESLKPHLEHALRDALAAQGRAQQTLKAKAERKNETDERISKMVSDSTGGEAMADGKFSSLLDVLQSPRPEVVSLLRQRQAANHALNQAEEATSQALRVVEFRQSLLDFLQASSASLAAGVREHGARATQYRGNVVRFAVVALEEQIPRLGNALAVYARYQRERSAAANSKLASKQSELSEHLRLYGGPAASWELLPPQVAHLITQQEDKDQDDAPSERTELEAKIREYNGVLQRSEQALSTMSQKQEKLWGPCLFEGRPLLPGGVLCTLKQTLVELRASEDIECAAHDARIATEYERCFGSSDAGAVMPPMFCHPLHGLLNNMVPTILEIRSADDETEDEDGTKEPSNDQSEDMDTSTAIVVASVAGCVQNASEVEAKKPLSGYCSDTSIETSVSGEWCDAVQDVPSTATREGMALDTINEESSIANGDAVDRPSPPPPPPPPPPPLPDLIQEACIENRASEIYCEATPTSALEAEAAVSLKEQRPLELMRFEGCTEHFTAVESIESNITIENEMELQRQENTESDSRKALVDELYTHPPGMLIDHTMGSNSDFEDSDEDESKPRENEGKPSGCSIF